MISFIFSRRSTMEYFTAMTTVARVNAAGLVVLTYRSFKTKQNKKKQSIQKIQNQQKKNKTKFNTKPLLPKFN